MLTLQGEQAQERTKLQSPQAIDVLSLHATTACGSGSKHVCCLGIISSVY